jgi:hypothetical protein
MLAGAADLTSRDPGDGQDGCRVHMPDFTPAEFVKEAQDAVETGTNC